MNKSKSAADLLSEAADIFRQRHKVYGDNYRKVGKVMADLFPRGVELVTEDDHNRFHLFMLQVVKLTRYTENWDRGGHKDSMDDLAVYAAMLNAIDEEINSTPIAIRGEVA